MCSDLREKPCIMKHSVLQLHANPLLEHSTKPLLFGRKGQSGPKADFCPTQLPPEPKQWGYSLKQYCYSAFAAVLITTAEPLETRRFKSFCAARFHTDIQFSTEKDLLQPARKFNLLQHL